MTNEAENSQQIDDSALAAPDKPIVLKLKKSGKKGKKSGTGDERKPKYSRGLKEVQKFEGNLVDIAKKTTRALSKGMEVYDRERDQSAREKTDGAIEDFIHNTAKASSAALKEAADIPVDMAEAISPISYRKRLRRGLRRVSKTMRLFRI